MTSTTQINIRLSEQMLATAGRHVKKYGFSNIQELIKETLREKLFEEPMITKKELLLVRKLTELSEKENLFGTEEELFDKLRR